MKDKQPCPGSEIDALSLFPKTITIMPHMHAWTGIIYIGLILFEHFIYIYIYVFEYLGS